MEAAKAQNWAVEPQEKKSHFLSLFCQMSTQKTSNSTSSAPKILAGWLVENQLTQKIFFVLFIIPR
jgi:hypothetical protein